MLPLTWLQSTHKTLLDCSGICGKKVRNNAMYNNYKHVNWGEPERASHLRVDWRFSLWWTCPSFHIIIHPNSLFIILFPTFRVRTCNSYSIQHKHYFYRLSFCLLRLAPQCSTFRLVFSSGTYPLLNGAVYTH